MALKASAEIRPWATTKVLDSPRENTSLDKINKSQDESPINWVENTMASVALQIVSRPLPGADMGKFMANMKDAADLWRKSGADVKVYTVSVGEIGNMVFAARWDSYEAYGKSLDKMVGEQSVQALMAKITASGTAEWVRSNLARELPI